MFPDQLLAEVLADLLDVDADTLTADTALADVDGWDSVNALRVLVYLERRLGGPVDFDSFAGATTVGDLAAVATAASGEPVR